MRSLLFVPGDSEKKLARAAQAGADALILDLEDSVTSERKAAARAISAAYLMETRRAGSTPRVYVRINSLHTEHWEADLGGIMPAQPHGIMLPKTVSGADIEQLSLVLDGLEQRANIGAGATRIMALITEVARSLLRMHTYVAASDRLEALTWGAEDLSAELGSASTREADGRLTSPYRLARDLTLIAAAAAGAQAVDTVFVDFRDSEGLQRECAAAARDGFTGKLAIHPVQVPVINAAFTPSPAEVAHAQAVVNAFRASPGAGVVSLDGRMLDRPHLVRAERVLARAATEVPLSPSSRGEG